MKERVTKLKFGGNLNKALLSFHGLENRAMPGMRSPSPGVPCERECRRAYIPGREGRDVATWALGRPCVVTRVSRVPANCLDLGLLETGRAAESHTRSAFTPSHIHMPSATRQPPDWSKSIWYCRTIVVPRPLIVGRRY
jgi:hypothetical protein